MDKALIILLGLFLVLAACSGCGSKSPAPSKPGSTDNKPAPPPPTKDCNPFYKAERMFQQIQSRLKDLAKEDANETILRTERRVINSALLHEAYVIHSRKTNSEVSIQEQNELVDLYGYIFDSRDYLRSDLIHPLKNKCF